jgi:hypothetical protein
LGVQTTGVHCTSTHEHREHLTWSESGINFTSQVFLILTVALDLHFWMFVFMGAMRSCLFSRPSAKQTTFVSKSVPQFNTRKAHILKLFSFVVVPDYRASPVSSFHLVGFHNGAYRKLLGA